MRKYLVIDGAAFNHDRVALDEALAAIVALSSRMHRNGHHWLAIVSFDHAPARRVALDAQHGAIGLEFNAGHLTIIEADPFGNLLCTKRFGLLLEDTASGQRHALSDALSATVAWAIDEVKNLSSQKTSIS
ncbi:hypothetical protein SB861_36500 [Paraburkholderia sp. SIMBA_049]